MENNPKYYHRRSYFGPILLIVVGLLFLGNNLGFIPGEGWEAIWKLWPVLLIIAGLNDLIQREGIAWPILLMGLGTFLLINNLGPQSWISWTKIIQLWPVLLIAVGIDIMFKGQSGWATLAGIVLTIALVGGAIWIGFQGFQVTAVYDDIHETYPEGITSADIDLSLGLGEIILTTEPTSEVLITGEVTPEIPGGHLEKSGNLVSYQLEQNSPTFYPHTARWELSLTEDLTVNLAVSNAVGEMLLDGNNIDLGSFDANQVVGRIVIQLPDSSTEDILIKQSVGTILIQIPEDARVAVDAKNGLTRVKFPSTFDLENGYYVTPGATRANADLFITIEQAVGLVTIQFAQ